MTAKTVADVLERYGVEEVVVTGGGIRNPTLMGLLRCYAPAVRLRTTEDWGISSEAKEAYAFAVLGFLSVHDVAGTVPTCTGAEWATVLGSIAPALKPLALSTPAKSAR